MAYADDPLSFTPLPFTARLARATAEAGAPLCVGLDPDPARLPAPLRGLASVAGEAAAAAQFCKAIVDATAAHAAAFKPNLAFFEALGAPGWQALATVCAHVRARGRLLVLDGKRGDVGHTAARYAAALYDVLGGDAATVAPYMGAESIAPFLASPGRCAFVLVATSNPGAAALQGLEVSSEPPSREPLYRHVARLAAGCDGPGETGFVVGATQPEVLAALREAHPDVPFLVPGVGAQGGSAADVRAANAGGPLLVNASRSVLYASADADFAPRARDEAARLAEALRD
ncbi:MAG: orotidine-5'-phosphate decarboxylase [Rubricoccaceae bacterium]